MIAGSINRENRLPLPAEALREIVINAVIHRVITWSTRICWAAGGTSASS